MTTLTFKNSKILKQLAEETRKSNDIKKPYTREKATNKGVWLVKDEGIYLMNGFSTKGKENLVVYADGYNPNKRDCWEDCVHAVGGDDFAEFVPLDDEQLNRLRVNGNLTIEWGETSFSVTA
tara:strand:- start:51 stop:416 length:366 start_codon:yes stop_codon:yes gene_type:complete